MEPLLWLDESALPLIPVMLGLLAGLVLLLLSGR